MLRFDQLIRPGMIVRDIKQRYPGAAEVFDGYGFRASCDDCTIEEVARKHGLNSHDIVDALNRRLAPQ